MAINQFIEQTNLRPNLTDRDIDLLVEESITHDFVGVCLPPFWVKKAARDLKDSNIQLVTVIGFPLGYPKTESKLLEIDHAINDGARELDIVMNISAFKSGMPWPKIELAKCAKIIHEAECLMKVILETSYLTEEEIITAAKLSVEAGADFVKTSTGFSGQGATESHVKLLRNNVPSTVGVKASGGIKSFSQAQAMIDAGAERIGTSSGVQIMKAYHEGC